MIIIFHSLIICIALFAFAGLMQYLIDILKEKIKK